MRPTPGKLYKFADQQPPQFARTIMVHPVDQHGKWGTEKAFLPFGTVVLCLRHSTVSELCDDVWNVEQHSIVLCGEKMYAVWDGWLKHV